MSARDEISGPLDRFLIDCALAKECTSDDLSVALMRAGETLALECYRRGAATMPPPAPEPAVSQVMPAVAGLWPQDELTPVKPPSEVEVPVQAWPYRSR